MASRSEFLHKKREIIKKLVKELSEFVSDEDIADIATRSLHAKVRREDVQRIRSRLGLEKEEGAIKKTDKQRAFADRYDFRSIRDFLKKEPKIKRKPLNKKEKR